MKDVHPIWLDVQNGKVYPVFDVLKGSGADGEFTYPDDDPNAPRLNRYTLPNDGVLVKTFGHLHPGGLHDTFSVTRGRPDHRRLHLEGEVLRTRGRGVVGRVDDHDARRLGGRSEGRRRAEHLDHLRHVACVVVRVDGPRRRVDARRAWRHRPVHGNDQPEAACSPTDTCRRTTTTAAPSHRARRSPHDGRRDR